MMLPPRLRHHYAFYFRVAIALLSDAASAAAEHDAPAPRYGATPMCCEPLSFEHSDIYHDVPSYA